MAQDFVQSTGTTFTMLWDSTFEAWNLLGITSQPAGMLLSRYGQILDRWRGDIPEARVLNQIDQLEPA